MTQLVTEQALFSLLEHRSESERYQHAQQLWNEVLTAKANPLTAGKRALFLHWSSAETVQLVGDWTFWQPSMPMEKIGGTDLHYVVLEFPEDARLQYKLVVDGQWVLDPANERVVEEGFGLNNEFWMPRYQDRSFLDIGRSVSRGTLERRIVESAVLASHREVFYYMPTVLTILPATMKLLIVHDGEEAIRIGKFPRILDNLHALGLVEPVAACFLSPRDRNLEYAASDAYVDFVAEELLPIIRRYFADEHGVAVGEGSASVAVTGASLGGLLATKTALLFPERIGQVLAQSPSYWWNRGEIFRMPQLRNAHRLHVVIQTGTICDARELSSLMAQRLRAIGARVDYFEYSQGHTWGNWRTTFADGIRALFPASYDSSIT
ncbi:MAG: alpha/beta hydrolase-fold protein [Chlorobi bacterium]|nr:alpha/beta hydrolase-fold protein [Chlorobiota bacterium]